jgi:hypothetical protein
MSWLDTFLQTKIRQYEHRRWATDDNRRVFPFAWGLEHIGGRADEPDPRAFLREWVAQTLTRSDEWFAVTPATDYQLHAPEKSGHGDRVLTFTTAVRSPWRENNQVHARVFAAGANGPAVVVLPQWNAKWDVQVNICRWLNRMGITAVKLSLPYHDRRMIAGHERADHLVAPNIGLTIQANRQAVLDTRRCLLWLAAQGYTKLGLVGTSIGSAIGFMTMAHDPLVRAGVFLHVSTYFADVVSTGMNTSHVWEGLRAKVSADELQRYWSPISPFPYISRMRGSTQKMLMVSGQHDPTFLPEFSDSIIREVRKVGVYTETLVMPCGHYSLELWPFSYSAALRMGTFLFQHLA